LLHINIPCHRLPHINTSNTSALIATTFPRSHNVAARRNTGAKSTLNAIKSLAKNDGDPYTEVAIRNIAFDDTYVSTTRDVDAVGPPNPLHSENPG
jgi:hypothetical protein